MVEGPIIFLGFRGESSRPGGLGEGNWVVPEFYEIKLGCALIFLPSYATAAALTLVSLNYD